MPPLTLRARFSTTTNAAAVRANLASLPLLSLILAIKRLRALGPGARGLENGPISHCGAGIHWLIGNGMTVLGSPLAGRCRIKCSGACPAAANYWWVRGREASASWEGRRDASDSARLRLYRVRHPAAMSHLPVTSGGIENRAYCVQFPAYLMRLHESIQLKVPAARLCHQAPSGPLQGRVSGCERATATPQPLHQ